jgi:hypothetical protein
MVSAAMVWLPVEPFCHRRRCFFPRFYPPIIRPKSLGAEQLPSLLLPLLSMLFPFTDD